MSIARGVDSALRVWDEIDHPNLKDNTEPTKDRARLMTELNFAERPFWDVW